MQVRDLSDDELWRQAMASFAHRDFYDVHEYLEELWRRTPAEGKLPLQGLIQAAVCLHHFIRGNLAGARILRPQAIDKLSRSPSVYRGLDIAGYVQRFAAATELLRQPGGASMNPVDAPLPETA